MSMPEQRIRDPTLYQWFFFLRWHSRDSDEERKRHLNGFEAMLWEAKALLDFDLPNLPASSSTLPQVSERLVAVPWQLRDGILRELEARTLLDAFYLQFGQAKEGEGKPADFASLVRWSPKTLDNELSRHAYLGEAICLCAEINEGLSEDELVSLTKAIIENGLGKHISRMLPEGITLPFGFFTLVSEEGLEAVVLLYLDSAAQDAANFVHRALPQLLLSRIKFRVIAKSYHQHLFPQTQEQEQMLDSLLKQAAQRNLPLEVLEHLSANISRQQATFIESISMLEEQLQTLQVCMRNIDLLLSDSIWNNQRQRAKRMLTSDIALFMEQVETDLRYFRITQQQADLALQSLLTITGVRGTQWERRMTLFFGIFAVMAIAQAFPELAWWWRLALIGLGSTAVGLGYWWLKKR